MNAKGTKRISAVLFAVLSLVWFSSSLLHQGSARAQEFKDNMDTENGIQPAEKGGTDQNDYTGDDPDYEREKKSGSRDKKDTMRGISYSVDLGFKGYYTLGVSPENMTYQPYGNVFLEHMYFRLTAGYSRFIDFQITDGFQSFKEIKFHRPEVSFSVYPIRFMEIYGGFQYSSWYDNYRSFSYEAGLIGIFNDILLEAGYNYSRTLYSFITYAKAGYTLSLYDTEIKKGNPRFSFSYFFNDKASIDVLFDYHVEQYSYYNDTYRRYITAVAGYIEMLKYFSLSLEFGMGTDSIDYLIVSPDVGFIIKPLEGLQLQLNYGIEFNRGVSLSRKERLNRYLMLKYPNYTYVVLQIDPKLRLVTIGRDFTMYMVSFGVSCKY